MEVVSLNHVNNWHKREDNGTAFPIYREGLPGFFVIVKNEYCKIQLNAPSLTPHNI